MKEKVFIVEALRTPVGDVNKGLKNWTAPELGAEIVSEFKRRYPILEKHTDSVLIGNNVSAGIGQNPARQTAILGGIPVEVNSFTLNQVCGSGLAAVCLAEKLVKCQEQKLIISGGIESTSHMPYIIKRNQAKEDITRDMLIDSLQNDGLNCAFENAPMGLAAEHLASRLQITREEQDQFAVESHNKAIKAAQEGAFKTEIIPFKDGEQEIRLDEKPRENTSIKRLSRLKPVFKEEGTITAGNASGLGDAAALLLLTSEKGLKEYNLNPLATIIDSLSIGFAPLETFFGLSKAIEIILERNNLSLGDIDLFEICESFASVVLGTIKSLSIDKNKVNIYGGDVALGHPLGASGVRILVTLIHALKNSQKRRGVAVIAMGGGHTTAVLVEI